VNEYPVLEYIQKGLHHENGVERRTRIILVEIPNSKGGDIRKYGISASLG